MCRAVELGQDDAVALAASVHALTHLAGDLDSDIHRPTVRWRWTQTSRQDGLWAGS